MITPKHFIFVQCLSPQTPLLAFCQGRPFGNRFSTRHFRGGRHVLSERWMRDRKLFSRWAVNRDLNNNIPCRENNATDIPGTHNHPQDRHQNNRLLFRIRVRLLVTLVSRFLLKFELKWHLAQEQQICFILRSTLFPASTLHFRRILVNIALSLKPSIMLFLGCFLSCSYIYTIYRHCGILLCHIYLPTASTNSLLRTVESPSILPVFYQAWADQGPPWQCISLFSLLGGGHKSLPHTLHPGGSKTYSRTQAV